MNPNPEIYGAPETWINSKNFAGLTTTVAELLHAKRAQICGTWIDTDQPAYDNYEKGSLQWGILGGKIIAQQPIDKSITAIGQGRDSAFHRLGVYANQQREGEANPQIRRIGTATYDTSVLNFAAFDARCPTSYANYANRAFDTRYNFKKSSELVWSPDGAYHRNTSTMNGTFNISPFTYYESRTILLQIIVNVTDLTTAELEANPPTSQPAAHLYTLETWKNDYSDHSITGAYLNMRYLDSYNVSTGDMSYRLASYGGNTYQKAAFMCLDKLTIAEDGGTNTEIYHYAMYADSSNIARIVLFKAQTGVTKWDNSNEIVALMPFDDIFGNTIKFGTTHVWYQIPYSNDAYEAIMCATACFGCPFTPSKATTSNSSITFNQSFTDADLCLPIILENGVADGDYTRGADNADNPFIDLKTPYDYDYNPDTPTPVDTNTYSNITGFNSISAGASATERYVLDAGNTRQLLSDLWTISHNIAGVNYDNYNYKILDSFLVSNPIDSIISLKRFPFNIPHTFSNTKTHVNLGKNHGSAQGYLTYNAFNSVQFAGINIFPRFGNSFLDYAPYTEYELYVPFCGTVKLNAGDILGHTLNCRLQIDLITGACTAYIMADSLVIETMTGTVSCELALTGIDSATIDANIQNSVLNHVNARTNKEVSMLSPMTVGGLIGAASNPFKTAGSIANAKTETQRAEYELTHIQTSPHTMGSAGGLTGWCQEFNARLMIYYPEGDVITNSIPPELTNLANYGHTTGFATIDNTTLANYSGFTVATNAILNFAATATEKEMIMNLLQSGVYL